MTIGEDPDTVAASLLTGLRRDLIERRIQSGRQRLEAHLPLLAEIESGWELGPQLLWRMAQWVDVGWRDITLVQAGLRHFPASRRGGLALRDYAALRMAEGMAALSVEDLLEAGAHFDAVLQLQADLDEPELLAVAHFWKARCQRKRGEYDQALAHTVTARTIAAACSFDGMAAVMRVLESWLYFQKGRSREALRILHETEAVLRETDDYIVLGNIQSTYGRIYRQEGHYDRAIEHFQRSIEEYRRVDPNHTNLARTLANKAYVERLVALDLKRKIDTARARGQAAGGTGNGPGIVETRERFDQLRRNAFQHLEEAARIYGHHRARRGAGTVHLNRGLLHLDAGALDLAEEEAAQAFVLGEEKGDVILMARSRLLQCMVENAKIEEGIEEDPRRHAHAARDYIQEAIQLAGATQNRRLLARVHTWHGLTLANEYFAAHDAAIDAMNLASAYLDHGFHDTAWEDLRLLKSRVAKSNTVDQKLLDWSHGAVGNRTFRQLEDEFAELVIPKVWEIEGRKIARVAARLSISPKKVRWALGRAGLLGPAAGK